MPTFAEWEARRRGTVAPQAAPDPVQSTPGDDLTPDYLGPRRHATGGDDYWSAAEGELLRTGKEAAIGMARGIPDTVSSAVNAVRHPLDTLMGIGHAVANPGETVMNLAKSPRDAGSLLTQTLLAPKLPGAANAVLREGPAMAGRAIGAVGRGAEAVGTSKVLRRATPMGALGTAMSGHPGYAALELAAPPALEYGGKGLQKLGSAMEGMDLSVKGNPFKRMSAAESLADPEADTVRETVRTAREAQAGGASRKQAAAKAGWPLGKSTEVPYQQAGEAVSGELFPYQKESLAAGREANKQMGLEQSYLDENPWALDASAEPAPPQDLGPALDGLRNAVRRSGQSPVENFYEDDPQARGVGGNVADGRMTGQFEEGEGGLNSIPGETQRSVLDQLSRLSGKQVSPLRMEELMKKFGGGPR